MANTSPFFIANENRSSYQPGDAMNVFGDDLLNLLDRAGFLAEIGPLNIGHGVPMKFPGVRFQRGGGENTAKTLSELEIHDSRNTALSGFRLSSAIAPARQNQFRSS